MKKAIVTGITGQDGSYLAQFLLSKNYEVHGIIRRASTFNTQRIDHLYIDEHLKDARLFLHHGDLSDTSQITALIYNIKPDEIYHLGAQSHVRVSFDIPEYTGNTTGLSTTRILEALRHSGSKSKFYQASSSEMFGAAAPPQSEQTNFEPRSPYAISKLFAYWTAVNYREAYNLFACNGIMFNHESPRRGETFVTRKITRAIANILAGRQQYLYLGNMDAKRDWGFAPEYVELQWKILQQDQPDDFVIGTGECHTVKDFVKEAFSYVNLDWEQHVRIDKNYFRPLEVDCLKADVSKAKKLLNWEPKVTFQELVNIMVDADIKAIGLKSPGKGAAALKGKGFDWL